jgi:hypothetical protein
MFRKRIILDGHSDATAILATLREQCEAAGMSPEAVETVISEVRGPLDILIQSGRGVALSNGQFRASRQIVTESAAITLDARFGVPPSLFARLRKWLCRGG